MRTVYDAAVEAKAALLGELARQAARPDDAREPQELVEPQALSHA